VTVSWLSERTPLLRGVSIPFPAERFYVERIDMTKDKNPRGLPRLQDGRGKGVGMPGGRRKNRNAQPCPDGGFGKGQGRGRGKNR